MAKFYVNFLKCTEFKIMIRFGRALEASLLEHAGPNGKRKRGDGGNWIDPLNPHDRERNAMVSVQTHICSSRIE